MLFRSYLDCEVYAMAAADTLGVRRFHLRNIQEESQAPKEGQYTPEEEWIKENENWV